MSVLEILKHPDETLTKVSEPIEEITEEICITLNDMLETLRAHEGLGLAAPQVGVLKRMIVIDIPQLLEKPLFLINPELFDPSEEIVSTEEGCLSLPDLFHKVKRPVSVGVRCKGYKGEDIEFQAHGLLAIVLQHEVDHLDGKLFVDNLSELKRIRALRKYKKLRS